MPIYEFEGKQYEFPEGTSDADAFDFLGQQDSPSVATAKDLAKTVPSALARGVAMIPAAVGDAGKMMRMGARKIGIAPDSDDYVEGTGKYALKFDALTPTSDQTIGAVEKVTGPLYQPKGRAAKYLNSAVEMMPGAIAGPGGIVRNAIRFGAVPGIASEGAGQLAEGTGYEPWARALGGFLGLGASALGSRPRTAGQAMGEGLGNVAAPQIDAAERLMQDGAARGVKLTWPEAIQQVTDSGTNLGNLQRVVEGSQEGGAVMRPVMAERPKQVQQAFDAEMQGIAAVPMNPNAVGARSSQAALAVIEDVRRAINRATDKYYKGAAGDQIGPRAMARLKAVPGFEETLKAVRADPHWNRNIASLPDESVLVLDAVKKRLAEQGENLAQPLNPDKSMERSSSLRASAEEVRAEGRRASRSYGRALDEQARLRERDLAPLQQGQVGKIAAAPDTRAAGRALLPENPLPNSAAETGRTTQQLIAKDPVAAKNLIRSRLEDAYQTASRDLQGGANEFAGANARKKLMGDRQMRRNVRAALHELPNGAAVSRGFERLMEVFQATGRRQHIGSQTEFNRLVTERLRQGGILGEAASSTTRANPLRHIRDRYERWKLGSNLGELARMMTDPTIKDKLIKLSGANPGTPQYRTLMIELSTELARDDGTSE